MNKRYWLSGLAVSLGVTGWAGSCFGQGYPAPYGNSFAPSGYPVPSAPPGMAAPSSPIMIGGTYPSLAQNAPVAAPPTAPIPESNYLIPSQLSAPSASAPPASPLPSQTTPLPPVYTSSTNYAQPPAQTVIPGQAAAVPGTNTAPPPQAVSPVPMPYADAHASAASTSPGTGPCTTCTPLAGQAVAEGNAAWSNGAGSPEAMACNAASPITMSAPLAPAKWIFGGNALIFNRIDNEYVRLTSNTVNSWPSALSTFDARMPTAGGFEVFGGRYFGCGRHAVMGSYWGLFPGEQSRVIYDPELTTGSGDSLRSDLNFTVLGPGGAPATLHGIEMPGGANVPGPNGGQNVYNWYDDAYAHRLRRNEEYHNVEINLFSFALGGAARHGVATCGSHRDGLMSGWSNGRFGRGQCGCGSCNDCVGSCTDVAAPCSGPTGACAPITGAQCSRLRLSWLGGIRWFRFQDYLEYASSENDGVFNGSADDFYYRNNVRNDLVGFQLGGMATYCTGRRINLYGTSKFGIFGNRITYDTYAGTNTTAAIVSSYNGYDNQAFDLESTATELALLGEGELGVGVRLSRGWSANCGYRIVGISGVATAPGQIPHDFSLLNDVRRIQNDHSLILHGVSFGGMYNW